MLPRTIHHGDKQTRSQLVIEAKTCWSAIVEVRLANACQNKHDPLPHNASVNSRLKHALECSKTNCRQGASDDPNCEKFSTNTAKPGRRCPTVDGGRLSRRELCSDSGAPEWPRSEASSDNPARAAPKAVSGGLRQRDCRGDKNAPGCARSEAGEGAPAEHVPTNGAAELGWAEVRRSGGGSS